MPLPNDDSVIVLDLNRPDELFELMRRRAQQVKTEFRWFTTRLRDSSYGRNPFMQSYFSDPNEPDSPISGAIIDPEEEN